MTNLEKHIDRIAYILSNNCQKVHRMVHGASCEELGIECDPNCQFNYGKTMKAWLLQECDESTEQHIDDNVKFLQIEIDILVGLLRPLEEELGWDITFLIEKVKSLPVEPTRHYEVNLIEMEDEEYES
mgnify:CR=1 FL=1